MKKDTKTRGMAIDPAVHERIGRMYDAYNARDLEGLLSFLCEDVNWPGDDERLHGRVALRDHWLRQWERTRTRDEVIRIAELGEKRIAVRIRQTVRDMDGAIMSRGMFEQTYEFRDGLVARMDLREIQPDNEEQEMSDSEMMLRQLYEGFNRRDIPAVLANLASDVEWANGISGGHVHGREEIRAYWTEQLAMIKPQVDPLHITQREDGVYAVEVHQVVRDLKDKVILDEKVRHVFRIEGGFVTRFDIENAGGLSSLAHN